MGAAVRFFPRAHRQVVRHRSRGRRAAAGRMGSGPTETLLYLASARSRADPIVFVSACKQVRGAPTGGPLRSPTGARLADRGRLMTICPDRTGGVLPGCRGERSKLSQPPPDFRRRAKLAVRITSKRGVCSMGRVAPPGRVSCFEVNVGYPVTHQGTLPRPTDSTQMIRDRAAGDQVDKQALDETAFGVRQAVVQKRRSSTWHRQHQRRRDE